MPSVQKWTGGIFYPVFLAAGAYMYELTLLSAGPNTMAAGRLLVMQSSLPVERLS
jgi:hypothetical protein